MNAVHSISELDLDGLLYIFIAYMIGMLASTLGGTWILSLVGIQSGTSSYVVYSPILAAILEPILTKLAPAVVVVQWIRIRHEDLTPTLQAHPFLIGAYGGACVGIVEAFGKFVMQTGMYAGVDTVSSGVILAALGHVLYGGIVGNAVYRDVKTRWWHNSITATLLAILIHLSWNGFKVIQLLNQVY